MAEHNPIMEIIEAAQGGQLLATFAAAAGTDAGRARDALDLLSGDIARAIAGLVTDSERYDDLMDVLDEEDRDEYLDEPGEILDRDAVEDGEDILKIVYGSLKSARARARRIGAPDGLDPDVFERMMTLAAPLTVAAMGRRSRVLQAGFAGSGHGGLAPEPSPEARGFISTMINAIVTGFKEGFMQAVTRKRSRRSRTTSFGSIFGHRSSSKRRKSPRRRRSRSPSLQELLGDLLKG